MRSWRHRLKQYHKRKSHFEIFPCRPKKRPPAKPLRQSSEADFVRVDIDTGHFGSPNPDVVAIPQRGSMGATMEIVLCTGRKIRIDPDFDSAGLHRLVELLED